MGKLHDNLKSIGYEGHTLEVYLVRVLFCFYAEDITIFEKTKTPIAHIFYGLPNLGE